MAKRKTDLRKLKDKLWELCKNITRKRYQNASGLWNCYTCGTLITTTMNAHTGHGIPSSTGGVSLRYNLNNLRVQCMRCNFHGSGEGALYLRHLIQEIGAPAVDELIALKQKTVQAGIVWHQEKIEEYEKILATL